VQDTIRPKCGVRHRARRECALPWRFRLVPYFARQSEKGLSGRGAGCCRGLGRLSRLEPPDSIAAGVFRCCMQWKEVRAPFGSGAFRPDGGHIALRAAGLWSRSVLQTLFEVPVGTEQAEAHGNNRNSQPVGHFLRRILQHIAQQTSLAQIGRKLLDGLGKKAASFAPSAEVFGVVFARRQASAQGFLAGPAPLFHGKDLAVAALPQNIDRGICRDAS
jgi:hypothetical protein